jgi:hypothetical protein
MVIFHSYVSLPEGNIPFSISEGLGDPRGFQGCEPFEVSLARPGVEPEEP